MNSMNCSFYNLAINDFLYLQDNLNNSFYNNITVQIQQIAEKLLKSVFELICVENLQLLNTHNLRAIYVEINKVDSTFILNKGDLSMLKDMYFDAGYPGDNFIIVTGEECNEMLNIMYDTFEMVNTFRQKKNLKIFSFSRKYVDETKNNALEQLNFF